MGALLEKPVNLGADLERFFLQVITKALYEHLRRGVRGKEIEKEQRAKGDKASNQ